jgi:nicotinamide-nucleotide amidase
VGLVYLAVQRRDGNPTVERQVFAGDRAGVRLATVARAFDLLEQAINA